MGGRGTSNGRGLWSFIRHDLPGWVQAVTAVILLGGAGAGGAAIANSGHDQTTTTRTAPRAKGTATAVYLSDLQPQGGDTPMRGDTQIGNQDFPHSIFYDNVSDHQTNASACQKVADPTCQATDYSIASGRYHDFSAMLGVTGCSGDTAHWSLSVDGVVVKSGPVALNSSPQAVSVAIPRGNDLKLLVRTSSFSGAACGGVNIIWGNARLS